MHWCRCTEENKTIPMVNYKTIALILSKGGRTSVGVSALDYCLHGSRFEPWLVALCCGLTQDTCTCTVPLFTQVYKQG